VRIVALEAAPQAEPVPAAVSAPVVQTVIQRDPEIEALCKTLESRLAAIEPALEKLPERWRGEIQLQLKTLEEKRDKEIADKFTAAMSEMRAEIGRLRAAMTPGQVASGDQYGQPLHPQGVRALPLPAATAPVQAPKIEKPAWQNWDAEWQTHLKSLRKLQSERAPKAELPVKTEPAVKIEPPFHPQGVRALRIPLESVPPSAPKMALPEPAQEKPAPLPKMIFSEPPSEKITPQFLIPPVEHEEPPRLGWGKRLWNYLNQPAVKIPSRQ
jgi:hypothetical protein